MNIGIDCRLWNETGVGRHLRALITELAEIDKKNNYWLFLRDAEYKTLEFPKTWKKVKADVSWHSFEEQIKMPGIYSSVPLDLLHIPYFSVPILTQVPYIVTIHDLTISHFATGKATTKPLPIYFLKQIGYHIVLNTSIRRARHILTVSESIKKQLVQEFKISEDKITVTYEAGGLEGSSKQTKPPFNKKYLLYVGNAHPHKNIIKLIEAFQVVRKRKPELFLILVGKDNFFYKRLLSEVKEKQINKRVVFIGEVANKDLWCWYEYAEAFIFPSLSEGFGIPGLEAMSVGCPVLASDLPVFHEIYGEAAMYFDPKNSQDIAKKVLDFLNNKKIKEKIVSLGIKQYKKFSWREMAKKTLEVYESCLGV